VGPRRWIAVVVGFAGVMIILRPGVVTPSLATVAVLISASCYALNAISVRVLGRTDSTAAMSFWFVAVVAVGAGALAVSNWQPLRMADLGWLAALGVTGALGQMLITAAFRCAPVSVVAPFEYSTLFWGIALDLTIWGELPPPIVFVGAAIVIASGLYLIHRERQSALVVSPSIETLTETGRD
jgi:drug/metabolite transporter (DMT)-like permease